MCRANDERCGQQTKGWLGRAHRAFEGYALKNAASRAKNSPHNSRGQVLKNCEQKALKEPAGERYLGWRQCIASVHQRRVALPLGKFRAPSEGWLVMRGRRGHHSFCDEVRAYDLKTGAAYTVQSCSGLALRPSGRVNAKLTNAARKSRTLMGKLPVSNLREAALMTFLASEAEQDIQAEPDAVALPPGISQKVTPTNNRGLGFIGSHGWFSSAQTSLAWSWIRRGKVQAEGALTWPQSSDAAQDYAVKLLKIAEVAMTPGCPPARLPPNLPVGSKTSGVSSLDANPRSRGRLEIELVGQLRALEKNPRCGKPTH